MSRADRTVSRTAEEAKKKRTLVIAVSVSMAAIVALWILVLPYQLAHIRRSVGGDASRWGVGRQPSGHEASKSFDDVMKDQQDMLRKAEDELTVNP